MAEDQKEIKKLYRSKTANVIAGIAGGMGDFFKVDPVIVRVVWVLLLIFGVFPAIIAYLLCWMIIPLEPEK